MVRGKSPFRFENIWLKIEGFANKVHSWWNCHSYYGILSYVLAKKLKALKKDIIQCNRREFGNAGCLKKELMAVLTRLNAKEGEFGLSEVENCERIVVRS